MTSLIMCGAHIDKNLRQQRTNVTFSCQESTMDKFKKFIILNVWNSKEFIALLLNFVTQF